MAPFYGWGSTASKLYPLRGGSLLFTIQFPEIPATVTSCKKSEKLRAEVFKKPEKPHFGPILKPFNQKPFKQDFPQKIM